MMDETIADCASKMRAIGLVPGDYGEHVLPTSDNRYAGVCRAKDREAGLFEIECRPGMDQQYTLDTLFHELAHSLPGCYNHDKGFLAACKMTDEAYGTNNELHRMHYYNHHHFWVPYKLALRFTGGIGDQYGIPDKKGGLSRPLYEIETVLPDGRRQIRELATGRTFEADLVEIRGMRYRAMWQYKRDPDVEDLLVRTTANSRKQYFRDSTQRTVLVNPTGTTDVVGNSPSSASLRFETTGFDDYGFHMVCEPVSGQSFSAEVFEISELCYRRRYLAYEAVMRAGIGGLPNPWMRCGPRGCKDAVSSLAALVESVWNINDLVRDDASESRLRGSLGTLDTRILNAAEKCARDLEDTLDFAHRAFTRYAAHRSIEVSATAMRMVADRV